MTRREAFTSLAYHPMYRSGYGRLSTQELALCSDFMLRHEADGANEFGAAVNRMFLDVPEKPKNKAMIQDLLTAANTIAKRVGRPPEFDGPMVRLDTRVPEGLKAFLRAEAEEKGRDLGEHVRQILIERSRS
jgi:hypothetical protein